ncbi:hypothetical protein [Neobacillus niacini]|uniref:hypothetical protein n=1 Tax=Neobacillus niacini TaxID=86668 RepID=UPI0028608FD3|nr:hypothetical protein [Neobacillus niacini]MDR6999842.1 hypothetical protein [Neobacillus niacini]
MPNVNRVRNGGFEQSTVPSVTPFWSGSAGVVTVTGGTQLLGDNNALLPAGGSISQPLLPLQVGEIYTFQAAFSTSVLSGTIDVAITGQPLRQFQAANIVGPSNYAFYEFDFTATDADSVLTITNSNADVVLKIDGVSIIKA